MLAATIVERRIEVRQHPDPAPGRGELLVRVAAAGLNRADILQRDGRYPPPAGEAPDDIPGLEIAGVVAEVGPGPGRFGVGDRVMAVVSGGGQAELAVVHQRLAMPVPEEVGWAQAGGFPEAFATAHDALFTQCGLRLGERLLVHGAAGGVGTAAVQLGVAAGARVTATVRDPSLRDAVAAMGARAVSPEESEAVSGPFDVVLELVGAPNLAGDVRALATGGRVAVIGVGAGATAEVDLRLLMDRRAAIRGSTLRSRSLEEKAQVARRLEASVVPLLAAGRIEVPVEATFPLEEVAAAYRRFEAGAKLGKIVLVTGTAGSPRPAAPVSA